MSIVPGPRPEKIAFFNSKLAPWQANLAALGLLAGDLTLLTSSTEDAEDAYAAFLAAQAAAKAATLTYHEKVRTMARVGADCIGKIRVAANASGNPDATYATAQIPPPATPSPVPPPGTASEFEVELRQDGALILKWKASNPKRGQGTTYTVERRLGATGAFTQIGIAGVRELTDATVPAGTAQVTYKITGVRSTSIGNPAFFTVNLGVGAEGEMTAAIAPKLAA